MSSLATPPKSRNVSMVFGYSSSRIGKLRKSWSYAENVRNATDSEFDGNGNEVITEYKRKNNARRLTVSVANALHGTVGRDQQASHAPMILLFREIHSLSFIHTSLFIYNNYRRVEVCVSRGKCQISVSFHT